MLVNRFATHLLEVAGFVFIAGAWSKWLGAGLGMAAAPILSLVWVGTVRAHGGSWWICGSDVS